MRRWSIAWLLVVTVLAAPAQPLVEILGLEAVEGSQDQLALTWEASPEGSDLDHAEIVVDGDLVAFLRLDAGKRVFRTDLVHRPAPGRPITVTVFDRSGGSASAAEQAGITAPSQSRLFVLALGVGRYQDPSLPPLFAADDARHFAALFPEAETLVLTDAEVTREGLDRARRDFLSRSGPNDRVLVFVAGHGTTWQDRFVFLTWGADPRHPWAQGLTTEDWRAYLLAGVSLKTGAFFLDACFAGQATSTSQAQLDRSVRRELVRRLSEGSGWYFFSASSPAQPSKEDTVRRSGLLWASLRAGLEAPPAADTDHDGTVRFGELDRWLKQDIGRRTAGAQTPESSALGTWSEGQAFLMRSATSNLLK